MLDLMIALAIMAVLLSLGLPSGSKLLANHRLSAAVHDISTQLNFARHTAIYLNQAVVICASRDTYHCDMAAEWHDGWLIFSDSNRNFQRDDGETIFRVGQAHKTVTITNGRGKRLRFRFDGSAAGSNTTLRICDQRGASAGWRVAVSILGRIRSDGPGIDHC